MRNASATPQGYHTRARSASKTRLSADDLLAQFPVCMLLLVAFCDRKEHVVEDLIATLNDFGGGRKNAPSNLYEHIRAMYRSNWIVRTHRVLGASKRGCPPWAYIITSEGLLAANEIGSRMRRIYGINATSERSDDHA